MAADPWVAAYDPANGRELWHAACIRDDVTPSPIYIDGLLVTAEIRSCLAAIRPGGSGDVTKTHVVWRSEGRLPSICSPAGDGRSVLTLTTDGILTRFSAADGAKRWEHHFATECHASPSLVADTLGVTTYRGPRIS